MASPKTCARVRQDKSSGRGRCFTEGARRGPGRRGHWRDRSKAAAQPPSGEPVSQKGQKDFLRVLCEHSCPSRARAEHSSRPNCRSLKAKVNYPQVARRPATLSVELCQAASASKSSAAGRLCGKGEIHVCSQVSSKQTQPS